MRPRKANFYDIIDSYRIGRKQSFIVGFCALLMLVDRFATQKIRCIVPILIKDRHLPNYLFSSIFSFQLFGLLICNSSIPLVSPRLLSS